MMNKLLTIIIPSYNVADYIDQCIESLVKNKNILNDLDIIAVNDGSSDDTLEKLRKHEQRFPECITVIDKENGGHGSGINVGIANAKGIYLKVLDSDDWVDSDGLTDLIGFIRNCDDLPDMIINPYDYVWQPDGRLETRDFENLPAREPLTFADLNKYEYLVALHSMTIRTSIFRDNNLPLIDEKISYDDVEFIMYPVPYVKTIVYLKPVIYKYRYGTAGQSVSPANYLKRRGNHMQVIDAVLDYYRRNKELFSSDHKTYFDNRMKWMLSLNANILLSMEDTAQGKAEFKAFLDRCSDFDMSIVPNGKLKLLAKSNCAGYSLVSWYYRKKNVK